MTTTALPRFNSGTALIDFSGVPSYAFHVWWDQVAKQVESNISDLSDQLAAIEAAQAAADAAQSTATTAQTTANSKAKVTRSSTAPSTPNTNDVWVDITAAPYVVKVWDGSAWQASARNTVNTNELTDGANLGGTALWSGVTGTGKPADNATVGADWGTNLTSRPTELTDGRVSTALNSSGGFIGTIASSVANSNNLLRKTSGGLYTGDLNATYGADLSSNVTNVVPSSFPPITSANIAYTFTGAITYTSTTTSATISVAAGSLIIGSTSVSYNSMSASVSGSAGTVVTYFLYVNNNAYNNGAHTLHATTSGTTVLGNDNNVYIGTVDVNFPSSGTGGGSGSGGGGACVTVDTPVLMADGSYKAAGEINPGDMVRTRHEISMEYGNYEVTHVTIVKAQKIYKATVNGYDLRATGKHRVYNEGWQHIENLGVEDGTADVVKLTVQDAHTYISNGILSHNLKPN